VQIYWIEKNKLTVCPLIVDTLIYVCILCLWNGCHWVETWVCCCWCCRCVQCFRCCHLL